MIDKTLGDILDETTKKYPDNEALVYPGKLRLRYKEFTDKINMLAKGLIALGIKKGDHVAIWANNVPEWIFLQFASAKIGAILVTVNTYYKSKELQYLLKQADITTLFLVESVKDNDYIDTVYKTIPELELCEPEEVQLDNFPYLKNVISISDRRYLGMHKFEDLYAISNEVSDDELLDRQKSLDPQEVINMQYTSGTTGFPKGVMLTHFNIVNNAYYVGEKLGLTNNDRMCIPVPFFHCFGCVLSITNCVIRGATMLPLETFDAERILQTVQNEKCTVLQGVPTMFIAELGQPNFKIYNLSTLRTGIMAGAPCPMEVMKQVMEKMHMDEITICYGLTESSPVITQTNRNDPIQKRVETVGKPLDNIQVKIVDPETGEDLPPNVPGELVSKGYNVMKGYYKMPEQTSNTIRDGWLHTKDLAVMDEEGYFKILGRTDDMIIRGGENVYPREIEEFLYTNEKVQDVAVIGVPSEKYGEEVFAYIKLKDGITAVADEIREFCNDKISRYKIPKYISFVEEFPMTASGKIQKYKLREQATSILKT